MLKVKDNVDLKELEKFGFIKVKKRMTDFAPCVQYWFTLNYGDEYDCITVFKDRTLYVGLEAVGTSATLNTLYDLIKADLVEKVEK